jgi:hypothetical protein
MMTNDFEEQARFLMNDYLPMLVAADPMAERRFGKLSFQGMIEHMSDSFRQGSGKDLNDCDTPPERIAQMQAFLRTDKSFRENTVNSRMPVEPADLRNASVADALGELEQEVGDFFDLFLQDKDKRVTNPVFGDLDYELWIRLLYKHAWHHLRQFGITESAVAGDAERGL